MRTLLLPKEWTAECRAYLALLAAIGPLHLTRIASSCIEDRSWWKAANKAWKVDGVGEVFASSSGIVLRNPTRNGLLSLFKMRVRSMRKEQANLPCFLQVLGFSYTGSSSPTWDTDDWPAFSSGEEDEHTVPERINLRVDSLTIDVGNGIEGVLENVHFLNLENLDVRTQGWKTTWSLVSRLLRDSKKLKVLRIRRGFSGNVTHSPRVDTDDRQAVGRRLRATSYLRWRTCMWTGLSSPALRKQLTLRKYTGSRCSFTSTTPTTRERKSTKMRGPP